jgi:glucosyl-3-phosphoglycerate synthase
VTVSGQASPALSAAEWFERRSYDHTQFADLDSLARRKREVGVSVSVVLPAREAASTIGEIIDEIDRLTRRAPLIDQLVVVDARSRDGTAEVASLRGAEVHLEDDLLPGYGPALGKGDAMWRALAVAHGDLVIYLDSDTSDFEPHFVYGLLGPLLCEPALSFVKAAYRRPLNTQHGVELESGGRATELTAKPLLNRFYPPLAGFVQPLAGEIAARRELLCSIPFLTGYAVEIGMLIDVQRVVGMDAMAQVDLGKRTDRSRPLLELGTMSYAILRAVELRLREDGRLRRDGESGALLPPERYVQAYASAGSLELRRRAVEVVERPAIAALRDMDR